MSIFGRAKIAKTSTAGRRIDVSAVEAVEMDADVVIDLAQTEEMPIVREMVAPGVAQVSLAAVPGGEIEDVQSRTGSLASRAANEDGESDVYVVRRSSPDYSAEAAAAAEVVTLFVYGWENVEPGPLSWAFPSLRAALDAVRAMRNAVEWCIVSGIEASIDAARAKGAVLVEQNA